MSSAATYYICFTSGLEGLPVCPPQLYRIFTIMRSKRCFGAAENSLQEHTTPSVVGAVSPCEDDLYVIPPCWDILYTPSNSTVAQGIIQAIQANNPGRTIPNSKVSFQLPE